jgi:hypothetical protein
MRPHRHLLQLHPTLLLHPTRLLLHPTLLLRPLLRHRARASKLACRMARKSRPTGRLFLLLD